MSAPSAETAPEGGFAPTPAAASPAARARSRFHHGDLRNAALVAALTLVETQGPEALTLREVAAVAGVNHRALYRHFVDLDALRLELAGQGFHALADAIAAALVDLQVDGLAGVGAGAGAGAGGKRAALLRAYVRFALTRPDLYGLMFGMKGGDFLHHPVLAPAVRRVTDRAAEIFRRADDPPGFSDRLRDRVVTVWGLAHGLCDLWRRGALRARDPGEAEAYILALLAADPALRPPSPPGLSPGQGPA
ncbi:MAG: hypothetical protein RLY86_1816 [Pseudomonadota bacterium]|jgi:AcrR family transcriptional regulator